MCVLSDVAVMCAILSGVIAGVCMVSNEMSDGMISVCVMSDGVVCVMCRGASRGCITSAAMMSGVCVPSTTVTGVCVTSGALPGVVWDIGGDSRNSRMTSTALYKLQQKSSVSLRICSETLELSTCSYMIFIYVYLMDYIITIISITVVIYFAHCFQC